jgi:hypothetical protein
MQHLDVLQSFLVAVNKHPLQLASSYSTYTLQKYPLRRHNVRRYRAN